METKRVTKNFINKIRNYLETENITQQQFAKQVKTSGATISYVLSGKSSRLNRETYINIINLINNNIKQDDNTEPDPIELYNTLKNRYDLSISDVSRVFDISSEDIQKIKDTNTCIPDVYARLVYFNEANEDDVEKLCKEKRYMVAYKDIPLIRHVVLDLYNNGITVRDIANQLYTSPQKVINIIECPDLKSLGYPKNPNGRKVFNDIINCKFELNNERVQQPEQPFRDKALLEIFRILDDNWDVLPDYKKDKIQKLIHLIMSFDDIEINVKL